MHNKLYLTLTCPLELMIIWNESLACLVDQDNVVLKVV